MGVVGMQIAVNGKLWVIVFTYCVEKTILLELS